ncbi:hypothetical protein JKP88DRAFT_203770 [Tribonema minus]|uniref:Uncharacterized protein n=1 Tax=Tribonema minus TaxID=303371 RepID=A0A835YJZ6_9STRA|nr:hypothetical protein JKP88DRAFT_203770 [Tribonema minus]
MGWHFFGLDNSEAETAIFISCAVVNGICLVPAAVFWRRTPGMTATWLMPLLCILMCYVNIILALGDSVNNNNPACLLANVVYALVVPLFLVALFEMAYTVHKTRSVKFCGIVFDQGHRINTEPCSWFLRHAVRMCALGLFILGILVYFHSIGSDDAAAGTGGYTQFGGASVQFILCLVPATAMAAVSLYLSIFMWRYGNNASIVVHSTACNRWMLLLLGSLCMLAGQIPPAPAFRASNALGQTILLATMLVVYHEVEREAAARDHFAEFLAEENRLDTMARLEDKGVVAPGTQARSTTNAAAVAAAAAAAAASSAAATPAMRTDASSDAAAAAHGQRRLWGLPARLERAMGAGGSQTLGGSRGPSPRGLSPSGAPRSLRHKPRRHSAGSGVTVAMVQAVSAQSSSSGGMRETV